MDTRREFIKKSILLSGAAGMASVMPPSIQRALAIDPKPGSTFLDAEHVVILMQENRSFDHCFGTLKGVRGYNDPRAITLPDQNLVWLQTNKAGETYAPFRFNIRDTKITWMGSIPHSRSSQVDANNLGKYDQWLEAKKSGNKKYSVMPLTMGHYTREDLPFNYAFADAFTICDQHFSSGMTSTWPNRLFMWSGTIRGEQSGEAKAFIRNDIPYGEAHWMTFPEHLEENGISWKVYQNDVECGGGFSGEERSWLANFGCNLLENFSQYNVRFSRRYVEGLQKLISTLPDEISDLQSKLGSMSATDKDYEKTQKALAKKQEVLQGAKDDLAKWSSDRFDSLSEKEKNLYRKAFTINDGDPDYHALSTLSYHEDGTERELPIPKGDILYQFRKDVDEGKLPTVSWLVPPQNFSDHPSAPWYGAWFTSEILDILTKNPEVWKKTIFILTYDENDGYFDHIPPFVSPKPNDPTTGKCSAGIRTDVEYINLEQEQQQGIPKYEARGGPIGLGYRVPMIIASPWSRGGQVCSQVFDHTSTIQFLEKFLNGKFGKNILQSNISDWRRTVCGDLTAAFTRYNGEKPAQIPFLKKDPFIEKIYNAKFREEPATYKRLSREEITEINRNPASSPLMAKQEQGIKPSCALPYQLYAEGRLSDDRKTLELKMEARNEIFGKQSAGSPFNVYLPGKYANEEGNFESVGSRSYAVVAGDALTEIWPLAAFENNLYHLRVYGPNGFYRELQGDAGDPLLEITCEYQRQRLSQHKPTGHIELHLRNLSPDHAYQVEIRDEGYKKPVIRRTLKTGSGSETTVVLDLDKNYQWYDFSIRVDGFGSFRRRYAGRVETGKAGFSDPAMGRVV